MILDKRTNCISCKDMKVGEVGMVTSGLGKGTIFLMSYLGLISLGNIYHNIMLGQTTFLNPITKPFKVELVDLDIIVKQPEKEMVTIRTHTRRI